MSKKRLDLNDLFKDRAEVKGNSIRLDVDACWFFDGKDLELTKILSSDEKDSKSKTIVGFGLLKKIPVALKISFKSLNPYNNSLDVEVQIYKTVIPNMLEYTPHLLGIDYITQCSHLDTGFLDEFRFNNHHGGQKKWTPENEHAIQLFLHEREKISKETFVQKGKKHPSYDVNKSTTIITEQTRGLTLNDFLQSANNHRTAEFWLPVFFQIAYTLLVFELFGFMHYDLHSNNIFIDLLDKPQTLVYRIGSNYYNIPTLAFVRIYDFDHASKEASPLSEVEIQNERLTHDYCKSHGECNEFVSNWDWFTILSYCVVSNTDPYVQDHILKEVLPVDILDQIKRVSNTIKKLDHKGLYSFLGRPCICQETNDDGTCRRCNISLDTLTSILSPQDFIDKTMHRYKTSKPEHMNPSFTFTIPG